jgi:transposase
LKENGITLNNDVESLMKLVIVLLGEIQKRDEIIEKQNKEILALKAEVAELKMRLNQNSQNSHKPPSSNAYRKAATPRKKGGKRGGKEGHEGKGLERLLCTEVEEVKVETERCECGEDLTRVEAEIAETRQVQDIPKTPIRVIDYPQEKKTCPCCGKEYFGEFPKGVTAPVQYGNNIKALSVLLNNDFKVPIKKVAQLLSDIYGLAPNVATILKFNAKAYDKTESIENLIKDSILSSSVAHADETGARIAGGLQWFHVVSTSMFTYLFTHSKRGLEALESSYSLIKVYTGKLVHDSYASYFKILCIIHALCGAHILRELTAQQEIGREWAAKMKTFLLKLKDTETEENLKNKDNIVKEYQEILSDGKKEEPPPERKSKRGRMTKSKGLNLIKRLEKEMDAMLLYAFDPDVPFTNNQAERDFRFIKVKMNVSHCFRSTAGAMHHARIMSVISTARKHDMNVFDTLKSIFEDQPIHFYQKGA